MSQICPLLLDLTTVKRSFCLFYASALFMMFNFIYFYFVAVIASCLSFAAVGFRVISLILLALGAEKGQSVQQMTCLNPMHPFVSLPGEGS